MVNERMKDEENDEDFPHFFTSSENTINIYTHASVGEGNFLGPIGFFFIFLHVLLVKKKRKSFSFSWL